MTLLLMAVTAGGYGWAVQKGYALAGREELAAWGADLRGSFGVDSAVL